MEHNKIKNIENYISNLSKDNKDKYIPQVDFFTLKVEKKINAETFINQAIIINADNSFTFQIKHIPVYINEEDEHEGIPIVLEPVFRKIKTVIGDLAVFICKDFLVNFEVITQWMKFNKIDIMVVPSFTPLVNPFRNKLGDIIIKPENRNKIFIFTNVAKYGGSRIYSYYNRTDYEKEKEKENVIPADTQDWKPYMIKKKS